MLEKIVSDTKKFLSVLESSQLYKFNRKLFRGTKKKHLSIVKRNQTFAVAFYKIVNLVGNTESNLSENEIMVFNLTNAATYLMTNLELVKLFLRLLIDPDKLPNSDKTTYKELIRKICDKIECNNNLRNNFYKIFLVDFRNAIAHNNYDITKNYLIYQTTKKPIKWSINDMTTQFNNTSMMLNVIESFINQKGKEIDQDRLTIEKQIKENKKNLQ